MAGAGPIRIAILADASNANRALNSTATTAQRVGGGFRKMALPAVAALGVIGAAAGTAVKSLARIERINAQTANAIKSTGGAANVSAKHVEDLAGKLEGLTASEAETTQEGANLLLTFTNIKNEAGKGNKIFDQTTALMVDMSRAMGQDTKSSALQLGKALNDPIKGVGALSRVGVSFTAGQKEQIKSLVETGDTLGAQKIILAELTKEFGGSGKAFAKTTEGQAALAEHAFGTLTETLTAQLLPAVSKLAVAGTKGLAWLTEHPRLTKGVVIAIAALAAVILAVNVAMKIYTATIVIYKAVQTAITGATKAWAAAQAALNIIMSLNPIGLVVIAIAALVAGIIIAYKNSETFRKIVDKAWAMIKKATVAVFDAVRKKIVDVFKFLKNLFLNFTGPGLIIKHWTKIRTGTRAAFDAVRATVARILGAIKTAFLNFTGPGLIIKHWNTIRTRTREIFEGIRTTVRDKIDAVVAFARGIKTRVTNTFKGAAKWLYNAGRDIIQGLIDGVEDLIGTFTDKLKSLTDKIPDLKGPASRDKRLLKPAGQLILEGLIDGFDATMPKVRRTLAGVTKEISGFDATINGGIKVDARTAFGAARKPEPTVVKLELRSSGSRIDDLLVELLRGSVRAKGGNVQLVLGTGPR